MSKTIRRDLLKKAVAAGKMVSTGSYHYDDMTSSERRSTTIPARLSSGHGDFIEGECNLTDFDFRSSSGCAYENEDGTITLHVHSNCTYDLKLKDGEKLSGGAAARERENAGVSGG